MSPTTLWVVVGGLLCLGLKLAGHLVPERLLTDPRVERSAGRLTVGLLAALVAVQTLADGRGLTLDARLPALALAAVALVLRAPFVVVVLVGAATAAGLRAIGLG